MQMRANNSNSSFQLLLLYTNSLLFSISATICLRFFSHFYRRFISSLENYLLKLLTEVN